MNTYSKNITLGQYLANNGAILRKKRIQYRKYTYVLYLVFTHRIFVVKYTHCHEIAST